MVTLRRRAGSKGRIVSTRGAAPATLWGGIAANSSGSLAVGAQDVVPILDPAVDVQMESSTLRRLIGFFMLKPSAIDLNVFFRIAIIAADADAVAAGAVPDPWVDNASFLFEMSGHLVTDIGNGPAGILRKEVDTRVMRKLPQGRTQLIRILENLAGSGTPLVNFDAWKALYSFGCASAPRLFFEPLQP